MENSNSISMITIFDWSLRILVPLLFFFFGMWANHRKETKGYVFFPPQISKKYLGKAFDIRIAEASSNGNPFKIHPDFSRELSDQWEMDYVFQFTDKRLSISGIAKNSDGERYKVYGNGYIRGDAEQGQSTVILRGEKKHDMQNGFVVYFLKWPNTRKITGYWVAYDKTAVGLLAFGGLDMNLSTQQEVRS